MSTQHQHHPIPLRDLWSQHAPMIRQLYEVEKKTLKEVKHILETEHNFPNTP